MEWGRRRVMEAVAVGLVLLAAYVIFPFTIRQKYYLTAIYNFGDSNSDTGSYSSALGSLMPPYGMTFLGKYPARFCDGRLMIDFIAEHLGFPYLGAYLDSIGTDFGQGANFASAGSTILPVDINLFKVVVNPLSLDIQVVQFELFKSRTNNQPKIYPGWRALFTVDHGQNDLHARLDASMTVEQVKASIPEILDGFSVAVEKLYKLGARSFSMHNTGPSGCLPYFLVKYPLKPSDLDPIGCIKSYNGMAQEFNKQLKDRINKLRTKLHGATLVYVDIYSIKYSLISQGKNLGFSDPLGYCCGKLGLVSCGLKKMVNGTEIFGGACKNPSEYISWDGIHYTEAANKWIVSRIIDGSFSEPQVPIGEAYKL